jgi:phenylalanyl-tRNA synthetase alpha chain
MHEYEIKILGILKKDRHETDAGIIRKSGINKDSAMWALQNLSEQGLILIKTKKMFSAVLTKEALRYMDEFPEEKIAKMPGSMEISKEIENMPEGSNIGIIWAKKNKWIEIKGNSIIHIEQPPKEYWQRMLLNEINKKKEFDALFMEKNKQGIEALVKRKLIEIKEKNIIEAIEITEKGLEIDASGHGSENEVKELTKELISRYSDKEEMKFKKYDINADTEKIYPARIHPLSIFINKIRKIWIELGFKEISGPIVESEFWVFDALFSPQDHPTREMQDTFFLSNPKEIDIDDEELKRKIKNMHEKNWRGKWEVEIAKHAVLRTHSTGVSAHYMHSLADTNKSIKLFTIGKIFRNETIDFKHLAEFHQVDGLIIGKGLDFSNLIFTLKRFYERLGINISIKPAYFPFVEPGLEINYVDKRTGEVIELGGAGIIRDEIKNALGIHDKEVLAFGLGIERLIFREIPLESLIELYKNDVGWLRNVKQIKV